MYNISKNILRYMKQRWIEMKEEIDTSTTLVSNPEVLPPLTDSTARNKHFKT